MFKFIIYVAFSVLIYTCEKSEGDEAVVSSEGGATSAGDSGNESAALAFSGSTGTTSDGDIALAWAVPVELADQITVVIKRIAGTTPPNEDCVSDGDEVARFNGDSGVTSYVDNASSSTAYSYRICLMYSETEVAETASVAGVQPRDTISPLALLGFAASQGSNHSEVDIALTFPSDVTDYNRLAIIRMNGSTAPAADCQSYDQLIYDSTGSFTPAVTDVTGANNGGPFSYRACIWDAAENLTSNSTVAGATALDEVAPPVLSTFTVVTGSADGEIDITVAFPADLSDYSSVQIRRLAGATAPSDACNDGDVVKTYSGTFTDETFTDTGLAVGSPFSYRACIRDAASNAESSQIVENIDSYTSVHISACLTSGTCNAYCTGIGKVCTSAGTNASADNNFYFANATCGGNSGPGANCSANILGSTAHWRCRCE